MTRIYIVRHGQTDSNLRHTCIGVKDIPLNKTGRRQAKELAARLKNIKIDAVYTSPLKRAVETISPYLEMKGMNMRMSFGLIERDYGEWDDMTFEEIEQQFPEEYRKWGENLISYKIPGGESAEEVQIRVNAFLQKALNENDGKSILLVTHLGTARHIISSLLGLSTEQSWCFSMENAGMAVIDADDGRGVLRELTR